MGRPTRQKQSNIRNLANWKAAQAEARILAEEQQRGSTQNRRATLPAASPRQLNGRLTNGPRRSSTPRSSIATSSQANIMDPVPIIDLDTFQNCRSNNEAPSQVQAKQGNEPNGNNPPAQWVKNLVDHGIIPEQYQLAKLNQQRAERQLVEHNAFHRAQALLLEDDGQRSIPEGHLMPLDYARPDIEDEPIIRSNNEIVIDTVQNKRAIKRPNSDFFENQTPAEAVAPKSRKMGNSEKLEIGTNGAVVCANVTNTPNKKTKQERDRENTARYDAKNNQKLVDNEKTHSELKEEKEQINADIDTKRNLLFFLIQLFSSVGNVVVNQHADLIGKNLKKIEKEIENISESKKAEKYNDKDYQKIFQKHKIAKDEWDKTISDWKNKEEEAEKQGVTVGTLATRKTKKAKAFHTINFELCAENVKIEIKVGREEQKLLNIQWNLYGKCLQNVFFQNRQALMEWAGEHQKMEQINALEEFLRILKPK